MAIDHKQQATSINDFALLAIKFLYLSNGAAIIAILADLNKFIDDEYPVISCALTLFIGGLALAFATNIMGYLMSRIPTIVSPKPDNCRNQVIYCLLALFSALLSFFFFGYGVHTAISIIH